MPETFASPPTTRPGALPSRSESVLEAIKHLILIGDLRPGAQLVEADLAERLGVSKTPVREALRTLAGSGLVTISPYKGVTVRTVDRELARAVYDMRLLIEPVAAARTASAGGGTIVASGIAGGTAGADALGGAAGTAVLGGGAAGAAVLGGGGAVAGGAIGGSTGALGGSTAGDGSPDGSIAGGGTAGGSIARGGAWHAAAAALDRADTAANGADRSLANRAFHRAIYAGCGNPILVKVLDELQDQTALVSSMVWNKTHSWEQEAAEHRAILHACMTGQPDLVRDLMRGHISSFVARSFPENEAD